MWRKCGPYSQHPGLVDNQLSALLVAPFHIMLLDTETDTTFKETLRVCSTDRSIIEEDTRQ